MTEAEWVSCADPETLLEQMRVRKVDRTRSGRRKLRLVWVCVLPSGSAAVE